MSFQTKLIRQTFKNKVVFAVCSVFLMALVLLGQQPSNPAKPARQSSAYDQGFKLFSSFDYGRRAEGWNMMLQAAESGDLFAKVSVAELMAGFVSVAPEHDHPLIKPDMRLALRYFREGVAAGSRVAMCRLAQLYSSGIGEPRGDGESPQALLLASAQAGNSDAMLLLSQRYRYGYGVEQDLMQAAEWQYKVDDHFESHKLIDPDGHPKQQRTAEADKYARVYSTLVRARKFNDPKANLEWEELKREATAKQGGN